MDNKPICAACSTGIEKLAQTYGRLAESNMEIARASKSEYKRKVVTARSNAYMSIKHDFERIIGPSTTLTDQ